MTTPVFRFAPSPNGRLHLGHAYSALLNADIAERRGGRLLLRIEDIDPVRSRPDLIEALRTDLDWLGLRFDGEVRRQSAHLALYAKSVERLGGQGLAYPCFCSRGEIAARVAGQGAVARDPDGAPLYPGTCRDTPTPEREARIEAQHPHTWRLDLARALAARPGPYRIRRFDRAGSEDQVEGEIDPARWGDAVIARRDVPTSYHLSVVIDDAQQGVTHVVRGADLEAATDLHLLLQALLDLPSPAYHHHELIRSHDGQKLAKSKGSESLADLRAGGVSAAQVRARLGF